MQSAWHIAGIHQGVFFCPSCCFSYFTLFPALHAPFSLSLSHPHLYILPAIPFTWPYITRVFLAPTMMSKPTIPCSVSKKSVQGSKVQLAVYQGHWASLQGSKDVSWMSKLSRERQHYLLHSRRWVVWVWPDTATPWENETWGQGHIFLVLLPVGIETDEGEITHKQDSGWDPGIEKGQ